jgi:hypothetical protein
MYSYALDLLLRLHASLKATRFPVLFRRRRKYLLHFSRKNKKIISKKEKGEMKGKIKKRKRKEKLKKEKEKEKKKKKLRA